MKLYSHNKLLIKTNRKYCGFFALLKLTLFDTLIRANWEYNIILIILFIIPFKLSNFYILNLNSNWTNLYLGSIIAIFSSININEGYTLYKDEKEWRKYYRGFCINSYNNILYQFNILINILLINYILNPYKS